LHVLNASAAVTNAATTTDDTLRLTGIHHVTAVSSDIRANYRFYTQVMGMRLVKRSVNQDDVSAYHLFYADGVGTPGTDLTFFDWTMPRERRGTRSVSRTSLRVSGANALEWWAKRLAEQGIEAGAASEIDGRLKLEFEDPEGQRLALVDDGGLGDAPTVWPDSPVPAEYQIRGLGPVLMSVPDAEVTGLVLEKVMNLRPAREYEGGGTEGGRHAVTVYEMAGAPGPHAELHVAAEPSGSDSRLGAGGVHHIAFRTPNEAQYHAWAERLNAFRIPNSGEVDRYYFRSLYFREPNGVLFEIATDGPGFAVDEDPATLGDKVALPPFLEPRREEIVSRLKPIL
jgi:glyoxalase family protein